MGRVQDQPAIVTGAASGIGRAVAALLAAEGAPVVLVDRDAAGVATAAEEIAAAGGRALGVLADVTVDADCRRAVEACGAAFGPPRIVVNSAGLIRRTSVVETPEAEWDLVMAVNVKSIYLVGRHAIPPMAAAGGGAIVNVGSGWGLVGGPRAASYCASKGAVVNLTRAMAIDHGPQGIRVTCVCPGDPDTPLLRGEARQLGEDEAAFMAAAADRPLARVGAPEDTARAILYLVSDEAAWVTGTTLVVDGGGLA
jgi:NAD(P)-dependent dehydrogenase (short-subunit alcohol dehydrogenase family)